ncbi:hypothetical protein DFP72DRAFT_870520 [Ephemerocybe angulata]|uniref:Uncharacterized protein n=1 Tax=Ephemerocybe angulata TaxID=980116 RepID=A0A8H6ME53_9AGAR|nr:hypothetical protein DFP72DRAFT_870520 [Tulosesus angulatus]
MKTVINTLTAVLALALSAVVLASPIPYGSEEIETRSDTELFTRASQAFRKFGKDLVVGHGSDILELGKQVYTGYTADHSNTSISPVVLAAMRKQKEEKAAQEAAQKAAQAAQAKEASKMKQMVNEAKEESQADMKKMRERRPITEAVKELNHNWKAAAPQPTPSSAPNLCSRGPGGSCSIGSRPAQKSVPGPRLRPRNPLLPSTLPPPRRPSPKPRRP